MYSLDYSAVVTTSYPDRVSLPPSFKLGRSIPAPLNFTSYILPRFSIPGSINRGRSIPTPISFTASIHPTSQRTYEDFSHTSGTW